VSDPVRGGAVGGPAQARMDLEPVKSTRIYEEIVRQVKQLIGEGTSQVGRSGCPPSAIWPRSSW
jgi:hypothetical protein